MKLGRINMFLAAACLGAVASASVLAAPVELPEKSSARAAMHAALGAKKDVPATPPTLPDTESE